MKSNISGWICLDKPEGMSSNKAMIQLKKILGIKTGYIGTLDPFATGVLPIAIAEACKFIPYVSENEKAYEFSMKFGETTDTLDIDGTVIDVSNHIPSENDLKMILQSFVGKQDQIPPVFSAIKIKGKRACDRVRSGEKINLSPREITVFAINLLEYKGNIAKLEVSCSKGTYVRSLARDIAHALGSVAYVTNLRRTKSGFFSINNSIALEKLLKIKDTSNVMHYVIPIVSPLDDIPALYLDEYDAIRLQNGLHVMCFDEFLQRSTNIVVFNKMSGDFVGVGFISDDGLIKPVRMCSFFKNLEK